MKLHATRVPFGKYSMPKVEHKLIKYYVFFVVDKILWGLELEFEHKHEQKENTSYVGI